MTTKTLLICLLGTVLLSFTPAQPKIRIFIAGDSTAQTYDVSKTLQRGWAQCLSPYFNENVEVVNRSIGGRSSGSYIREGRWDSLMVRVQPGDYVLIQFGHNDTSTNQDRHVEPADYTKNFLRFCADVRAKGANPIILTSIVMREFTDGQLVVKRPHFAEYVELARQAAKTAGVPLIDMNQKSTDLVRSLGDEASKKLYWWVVAGEAPNPLEAKQDDTHLREEGAVKYAGFVAEGVREQNLQPLVQYLK